MEGLSSKFFLLLRFPFLGGLGDLGFTVGIHPFFGIYVYCPDGCMYVGFFEGICGFVISRGLITQVALDGGVLSGFR